MGWSVPNSICLSVFGLLVFICFFPSSFRLLLPIEGRVEWHHPCMGVVMPRCMSVACRSTSYAMSVSFHPWKDALNGTAPVWGRSCPDVCPWHVVLHLTRCRCPSTHGRT